ncbi:MAG: ADP-ribosylglycohydrolase family protein, partial [Spirochaetota bacterium]
MEQMSFKDLTDLIDRYAELKSERGAHAAERHVAAAKKALANALDAIRAVAEHDELRAREPDSLEAIEAARPRRTHRELHPPEGDAYRERLSGALLARSAGCILGAPVELKKSESMEQWAAQIGDAFPPTDYWSEVPQPESIRYNTSRTDAYTRSNLNAILVDDDLQYTLLGLLILEEHGRDFSTDDVGKSWLRYLPYACTAEDIALGNLRAGVPAEQAGATDGVLPTGAICFASTPDAPTWSQPVDNPYQEWIGADIRSDGWAYAAPGWPERAAEFAWRDARLSHRRH